MAYTLDVESFISEVQKHPELWDTNCEENRYKSRKQAAWAEIARLFIQDFDDLPEMEKNEVYKKLFSKWRNIRDSFVRHIKRKGNKKGYMYAKHLAFLKGAYAKTQGSDDDWSDDDKRSLLFKQTGWSEEENSVELKKRRIAKTEPEESAFVDPIMPDATCSYPINAEDEDRSFFDSLLPAVRKFDLDQKLDFRCQVLGLIKKIRNGQKQSRSSTDEFDE